VSTRALEALDRVLNRGGEPDDVLRSTVRVLCDEPGISWAGVAFLEQGELVLGPSEGEPDEPRRTRVPVVYQGARVGELWVDGDAEQAFLARVALLVSAHVLIGWDTRGEGWEP
jgi:putative methionine-R-sulfoxide reductase with GAF domain